MDIFKELKIIDLNEAYRREIFGLGEIYEIMSVEHKRKKLLKKYHIGKLYLSANKNHSGRGMTMEEMKGILKKDNQQVITNGYTDSPPWASKPLKENGKKEYHKPITVLVQIIFWFLIRMEFIWQGERKSHMIYGLVTKK